MKKIFNKSLYGLYFFAVLSSSCGRGDTVQIKESAGLKEGQPSFNIIPKGEGKKNKEEELGLLRNDVVNSNLSLSKNDLENNSLLADEQLPVLNEDGLDEGILDLAYKKYLDEDVMEELLMAQLFTGSLFTQDILDWLPKYIEKQGYGMKADDGVYYDNNNSLVICANSPAISARKLLFSAVQACALSLQVTLYATPGFVPG